ncbi:ubiquitin-conjugating enzyme E2 U-like isoform X1 [Chiloscyllium plagiosum]|uniref:ubiquitin-conjugating enzyme E2 U-like isoform X1 n=1 Tax=Chiloscyllium plagiosum TaxID=36176 RepID=UPI001CB7B7A0|nr:ubiquitin-conjugating enzyme E2 U-like isoform X1 [Chiloscyllium plagiosum]XP_043556089.1 ubiquitin-conjugating enzyme E2 U-like isoform X1 [Chiloscyllium plagiosum]
MQSKAYLLLESEYAKLQETRLFGITVSPVKDDLLEWVATVQGLKDSLWEGAVLQVSLKYTEDYNSIPPTVTFNTIPFHPNVDSVTGKPCIDFLDNPRKWREDFSLTTILLTIQVMLSNPVLEDAVNVDAAEMLRENPVCYREMILECVRSSRQLNETGIKLEVESFPVTRFEDHISTLPCGKPLTIKRIAFDDYHKTWCEIATTKATESHKDPMPVPYPHLKALYDGLEKEDLREEIEEQNKEFNYIMYGAFKKERKARVTLDEKLARINRMKNCYIMDKPLEASTSVTQDLPTGTKPVQSNSNTKDEEMWDKEVDSLVGWTAQLNLDELEG